MASIDKTLFDRVGGFKTLEKVHKIFYDKAYEHVWLKHYFADKPQEVLEQQQTDFMAQLMGGPKRYAGKTPKMAHQHINITEELFKLRQDMLSESLAEAGLSDELRKEWLKADATLKLAVTKKSINECTGSYAAQKILDFPKPANIPITNRFPY
ncbi:MAG TPA: group 1 truncated hemoglobin [Gammaproteobacteria bacterium]|nr:group 1 truncated hemoglobin [Gammaproteobacteria bacterium]